MTGIIPLMRRQAYSPSGLRLRSKIQHIKYLIDVHEDEAVVYSIPTITADSYDSEMMARMAEFICRANYNLKNGNFEMDYRDGEIRFKKLYRLR